MAHCVSCCVRRHKMCLFFKQQNEICIKKPRRLKEYITLTLSNRQRTPFGDNELKNNKLKQKDHYQSPKIKAPATLKQGIFET